MRPYSFLLFLALSACEVFDPEEEVVLGTIAHSATLPLVTIPDIVDVGEPFHVDIQTVGNGCFTFQATETKLDGTLAEIRPFDRVDTDDDCDPTALLIDHRATLRFNRTANVLVRVIGATSSFSNGRDTVEKVVRVE